MSSTQLCLSSMLLKLELSVLLRAAQKSNNSSRTIPPSRNSVRYEVQRSRILLSQGWAADAIEVPRPVAFCSCRRPERERWDCQGALRREFASSETRSSTRTSLKAVRHQAGAFVKVRDPPR